MTKKRVVMNVRIEKIISDDARTTPELAPGEVVEHAVRLSVDGRPRVFSVYLRAHAISALDASVVYGDELLEELLRFEPAALGDLYRAVARYRRGSPLTLPLDLVEGSGHGGRAGAPAR